MNRMLCVSVEEMKKCDTFTVEKRVMPSLVLMENAAFEVFRFIVSKFTKKDKFIVFVGKGNNGGDGYAVARLLHTRGYDVTVCVMDAATSNDARWNAKMLAKYDIPCKPHSMCNANSIVYTVAIDAVIGSGFTGVLEPHVQALFKRINEHPTITRVAIDIASGVEANTGFVSPNAFRAHYTVTFEYPKYAHFLQPGKSHTGTLIVSPIGASGITNSIKGSVLWYDELILKKPKYDVHKYSKGHVAVFGGCAEYQGAPVLVSESVLYAGAGYTALYSTATCMPRLPEIVVRSLHSYTSYIPQKKDLEGVLVVGSGIGRSDDTRQFLKKLFNEYNGLRLLLDGDALYFFNDYYRPGVHTVICTPHEGEFSYMSGLSVDEIRLNRMSAGIKFVRDHNCIVILKSESTVIFSPDEAFAFTPYGNTILATMGSGDLLAGTIAGLWASQDCEAFEAAQAGVCLHGYAAEMLQKRNATQATASDLQQEIRALIENKMI